MPYIGRHSTETSYLGTRVSTLIVPHDIGASWHDDSIVAHIETWSRMLH
ncbi:MAG: hypothetical protein ACK56F_08635 [bacterium]